MPAEPRILKDAAPLRERRIAAVVFDADRQVRGMVARAEDEARRIVAQAEAARARLQAEAAEAGRREGEARAAAALARAAAERDRLLRDAAHEVAELALAVARKVLGRELDRPGAVVELAGHALAEARGRRQVVLRVHPDDAREVRAAASRLAAAVAGGPLELREDPAVSRGGAIVDTDDGRIDAGIEAQLDVLARALEEALP
jgi:type III secretion protein L